MKPDFKIRLFLTNFKTKNRLILRLINQNMPKIQNKLCAIWYAFAEHNIYRSYIIEILCDTITHV